ncbi:MAG: hypothetical protein AABY18_03795 [Candidatus Thermoplasmatota archaeon]
MKRKTLTRAEAAEALKVSIDDVPSFAWPIHVWCWVRGMPPLNVVIVKRGTTADPEGGFTATDYDVVHEAMGHTVYTLEHAWHYPWDKVPDPTPEQLSWALAAHASHHKALWDFRFLDLELELQQRDEARGRKRPAPAKHASWKDAEAEHRRLAADLAAVGLKASDLRPPGKGPYPPPRPIIGNWAD